jgi:hypothetical protein
VAGLTAAWCIASFWFPFGWDQGIIAAVGDAIVRGEMPYRDAWEMKGPLAYYGFALAQVLFGRHMWSVRIVDLALLIIGMVALAKMVSRVARPIHGAWAAVAFALWIGSLTWFHTVQPDTWASVLIILAAWPLVARKPTFGECVFSGAMIGCAVLIKPLYVLFLFLPLMRIFEQERSGKGVMSLTAVSWTRAAGVIGMALAPSAVVLVWFAWRGALGDLIKVHILYTWRVYSSTAHTSHLGAVWRVAKYFFSDPVVFALPVIAAGVWSLWRKCRATASVVVTWLILATMCVAIQGRFFRYHWVVLFPAVLFLSAVGLDEWCMLASVKGAEWNARSTRLLALISLALAGVAVLRLASVPASGVADWLTLVTGRTSSGQYYASHVAAAYVAGDDMKASAYIRERTSSADTVAVYGNNADINFLSGRRNPTRFVFALPLTAGGRTPYKTQYRGEYIAGLHRHPPAYLVMGVPWGGLTKDEAIRDFPELRTFLAGDYHLESHFGSLDLYRWNAQPHRIPAAQDQEAAKAAGSAR